MTLPNGDSATITFWTTVDATAQKHWKKSVSGTKWTKTFVDGLGRPVRAVSGYTLAGTDTGGQGRDAVCAMRLHTDGEGVGHIAAVSAGRDCAV